MLRVCDFWIQIELNMFILLLQFSPPRSPKTRYRKQRQQNTRRSQRIREKILRKDGQQYRI